MDLKASTPSFKWKISKSFENKGFFIDYLAKYKIQEKIYLKINQFVQILATIIVSFNCVRLASMDTNTKNL
jgi:hypothetical protein